MAKTLKKSRSRPSLEREVIAAVIALYLLICAALLTVHFVQPDRCQETSSSSPSHSGDDEC